VEYSRNLTFHLGGQMEQIFQGLIDRTRARLNVKKLRTIFGFKTRPYRNRKHKSARLEVVVETPNYSLTIFKLHFGLLTLKAYTKGERVLRFEAIVHNTKELGCGRLLDRLPQIIGFATSSSSSWTTCTAWMLLSSAMKPWIDSPLPHKSARPELAASI
jgi:hypothetical protein